MDTHTIDASEPPDRPSALGTFLPTAATLAIISLLAAWLLRDGGPAPVQVPVDRSGSPDERSIGNEEGIGPALRDLSTTSTANDSEPYTIYLVATDEERRLLIEMGERHETILVVGNAEDHIAQARTYQLKAILEAGGGWRSVGVIDLRAPPMDRRSSCGLDTAAHVC